MSDEPEVSEESLLATIADFDAGKDTEAVKPDKAEADPVDDQPEAGDDEKDLIAEAEKSDGKADKDKSQKAEAEQPKSKQAKEEARKTQTWEKINADKEALRAERESLQREREEFLKQKKVPEVLRDEHGATAEDYRVAAKQLKAQGNHDHAEAAEKLASNLDKKEQEMRQQQTLKEGAERWTKNLADLTAKHPDLAKPDSPLSQAALKVLETFPMLKKDPDGIKYAVRAAEIELQAKDFEGTKAEFTKLKAEHEKLQKKLSITGGSPTAPIPGEKSFKDESLKEMGQRLEQAAVSYDRDNGM
jgi:hypothetical protein